MKIFSKFWPFLLIFVVVISYYWKVIFKGLVPFPGDIMVGAYLPWLEYKWDTVTGVAFKANPSTPDIYSAFYLWKSLIAESLRNLQLPFWNPYSYSGYPLLANFHSGVFNPLNLFMVVFGDVTGWSIMIIAGSFSCFITMYLLQKQLKLSSWPALIGSLVYAFSGFTISWSMFINAVDAMIWLPLLVLLVDKYFETGRVKLLYWLPLVFFLFIASGHFQISVYGVILLFCFTLQKIVKAKKYGEIYKFIPVGLLAIGIVFIQIIPTMEMASYGIRSYETATAMRNYGLSPIRNLIGLFAPDFFGNPVTGNFWGFFNYHETIFYSGLITSFSLIWVLFCWKKIKNNIRFFWMVSVISLLFGFDTIIGKSVYILKIPGISTSDAGRIAAMYVFGGSIVLASLVENLKEFNRKMVFLLAISSALLFLIFFLISFNIPETWGSFTTDTSSLTMRRNTAFRNLIFPSALMIMILPVIVFFRRHRFLYPLIFMILVLDLFRFGWKYSPFVPSLYMYPETTLTQFLEKNTKNEPMRIDREKAEILPNATWTAFRLMSPSGYDPMALKSYVIEFDRKLNSKFDNELSRYSEIAAYDAEALGKFNVKYLLAVKRDKSRKLGGDILNKNINLEDWNLVYESTMSAVLQNKKYLPRVRFIENKNGQATITHYSSSLVNISFSNSRGNTLLLADSWYPGWKAYVNGKETPIDRCEEIFRCVKLEVENGELIYKYTPSNFTFATIVSFSSLTISLLMLVFYKKK